MYCWFTRSQWRCSDTFWYPQEWYVSACGAYRTNSILCKCLWCIQN
jgi:hypothetical protein